VNAADLPRRRFLHLAASAAAFPAVSRDASAQSYPARPITMIVPFAPGSPIDVLGRILAERMSKRLLQPIVVENVTGAEGNIGTGRVARARPDGYVIDLGGFSAHVLNAALYSLGCTAFPGSPAAYGKFIADETAKWSKVVRAANIRVE
jgi:tripartite-type tricarboxylate transporter receptor subunit TctC